MINGTAARPMAMRERLSRLTPVILGLAIFALAMVYLTRIHPLYISDTDDWTYLAYWRRAAPIWGDWNPTRVLPEILMPITGAIAAFVVTPITGDYIEAQMLTAGFVVSLAICAYAMVFYHVARKALRAERWVASSLTVLFLALHLLIFRSAPTDNQHLLYSPSLTTYFYYTVSNILNASLALLFVLGFWGTEKSGGHGRLHSAVVLFLAYFALVSNLFASVILAAAVGAGLVIRLVRAIRAHDSVIAFARRNVAGLAVIAFWLVVQLFEANGGRASSLQTEASLVSRAAQALSFMLQTAKSINHSWLAVVGLCLVAGAITAWRHRREHVARRVTSICAVLVLASLLAAAYLTLACAKVAPETALRADIIFGIFYPVVVIAVMGLGILLAYHPQIKTALPVFAFFMLCLCNTQGRTFANSSSLDAPESSVREIDHQIVEQCTTAVREGKNEVVLEVPKVDSPDNWPFPLHGEERISAALKAHGVIDRDITITFSPTEEKSHELGVGL